MSIADSMATTVQPNQDMTPALFTRNKESDFTAENAIVCLAHAQIEKEEVILAGSENGWLYMWKPTQVELIALSLYVGEDSVNCICFKPASNLEWLVGFGVELILIKAVEDNLVIKSRLTLNDEVNAVNVNEKVTFAAAADDSGCLTLIDLKTFKIHKKLLGHKNICSAVKFRPKNPWSIVTGGLDCLLILWDFKKGQDLGSVDMSDEIKKKKQGEEEEEKNSYVVNPPLIHALDISTDGLVAVIALENGKIMFFTIGGKGFKLSSVIDAHTQGVSCVHLLADMTLFSCGNDKQLSVWKLSTARAPGKTLVFATNKATVNHGGKASSLVTSTDGKQVWIADETFTIACYNYEPETT